MFTEDYTPYKALSCQFYDALKGYATDQEVTAYIQLMPESATSVLEAMSGSGRLLIPLMQRGYIVDGVDTSSIMLERCCARARLLQLSVRLYHQSLEALKLPHLYDAITIAVGSFQLIIDDEKAIDALRAIRRHLRPGGVILIDTFMPDLTVTRIEPRSVLLAANQKIILYTRYIYQNSTQTVQALNEYQLVNGSEVMVVEREIVSVVWRTRDQWHALCNAAGLSIIDFYPTDFRPALESAIMKLQ